MGAWGSGPFDNDVAADFLGDLERGDVEVVRRALETIANAAEGEYLDVGKRRRSAERSEHGREAPNHLLVWREGRTAPAISDGAPARAACELVALAFEHSAEQPLFGEDKRRPYGVTDAHFASLKQDALRVMALRILPRLNDPKTSELASLWAGSEELAKQMDELAARLKAAGAPG